MDARGQVEKVHLVIEKTYANGQTDCTVVLVGLGGARANIVCWLS